MEDPVDDVVEEPAADELPEPIFRASFGVYYEEDILQLLTSKNPDDAVKLKSLVLEIIPTDDVTAFEFLTSNGYKIEVLNDKNQTCIHLAYYADSWEILSSSNLWLLNLADDAITCSDTNGLTFLHIACYVADTTLAEKCLNSDLDCNAKFSPRSEQLDHNGFTPLHFASTNQELNIVKLLLARGADVNAIDSKGRTPLHIACCAFQDPAKFRQDLGIIGFLLENNSSLSIKDKHGNSPLFSIFPDDYNAFTFHVYQITSMPAIETKSKLDLLLKQNIDLTIKNTSNDSILHCVIKNLKHLRLPSDKAKLSFDDTNHLQMIQKIFHTSPNIEVNGKNITRQTPLQLAVSFMSTDIVQILLDHGADVATVNFDVINNGHCFYYPYTVPNLESVINIELITRLLHRNKFKITMKENLNILKFLVHYVKDCECFKFESAADIRHFGKIINFGPLQHNCFAIANLWNNEAYTSLLLSVLGTYLYTKKIAKFYCSRFYTLILDRFETILRDYKDLDSEQKVRSSIIPMKSTMLKESISLYDVMVKHPHYVNKYLGDIKVYSSVLNLTSDYDGIFKDIIEGHMCHSLMREYIERSAYDYLECLFPFLPEPCCKVILRYLDEESILNVCAAALIDSEL